MITDERKEAIIEKAIKDNITITYSKLYEAVYAVATDVVEEVVDLSCEDVKVLRKAQLVLQVIKDTDPGVYDGMIDNVLRLIHNALQLK